MQVNQIDDRLSVAPQIRPADVAELAAAGFRAIIFNRPDGEGPDQPTGGEIAVAAAAGLAFRYLPIVSGKAGDEDAAAFAAALAALPGPALAHCRTGTRSATLWSLAEAGRRPLPKILRRTNAAGYNMNAGGVLFGVKDYVPTLMKYVERYRARMNFFHNLVAIDGPGKVATFEVKPPRRRRGGSRSPST